MVGIRVLRASHVVADQFGIEAVALDRLHEALAEPKDGAAFHVAIEREDDVAGIQDDLSVDVE